MPTENERTTIETIIARICAKTELLDGAGNPFVELDGLALVAAMQPDGSWADVTYLDDNLLSWAAARHMTRLHTLARGWYQAQSPWYQHNEVFCAILRGLDYWYDRKLQNPNWWWNEIGLPTSLGETLLCLKGCCDPVYIERAIPALACHQPLFHFTGQNLVWVASIQLYQGLLTDDVGLVAQSLNRVGQEIQVFPEDEGMQPDMSFHQHGKLLYSGGYGQSFVADVGRLLAFTAGTIFAFPPSQVARFARYVLDGSRWMIRGRTFEPGAIGREITRVGHASTRFVAGLRDLASFEHPRQQEAQASAAIDPNAGQSIVVGNRYFWCSDLMTQHRPGYYLSVRMTSTRVVNADVACCGGEGRLCHHIAEGATFIMRDGDEYRDIYPVWNWRQIPGTTVLQERGDFDPEALRGLGEHAFAGGASDGQVGCAALDFSRGTLAAKKSWFFFDEGMVALGAGITASGEAPVRTTLNQCHWRGPAYLFGVAQPLAAGEYQLTPGAAYWQDGVTYRILDGTGTLRLGTQRGAWSDCGVGSSDPLTLAVMNAGLEHGVNPAGATYAYAVLPDVAESAAFTDDPARFMILRNDATLQAVWHTVEKRGHAVFYAPGTVSFPDGQQIGVDLPCILLYHPLDDDRIAITLAQPEQREGMVTLTLTGPVSSRLSVPLPSREYAGSSMTVIWHVG